MVELGSFRPPTTIVYVPAHEAACAAGATVIDKPSGTSSAATDAKSLLNLMAILHQVVNHPE